MRFLRYITLLLLAVLTLNVLAQENGDDAKKGSKNVNMNDFEIFHIEFRHGDKASPQQYESSISDTYIYTFASLESANKMLQGLATETPSIYRGADGKSLYKNIYNLAETGSNFVVFYDSLKSDKRIYRFGIRRTELGEVNAIVIFNDNKYDLHGEDAKELREFVLRKHAIDERFLLENYDVEPGAYPLPASMYAFKFDHKLIRGGGVSVKGRSTTIPPKPAEKPGVLIMDFIDTFKLPFKVQPNQRLVVQPIWYDRVDIADTENDTVFAYGKPVYFSNDEFKLTQKRHVDYKMRNDRLYSYCNDIKKARMDRLRLDTLWSTVCERLKDKNVVLADNDTLRVLTNNTHKFSRNKWVKLLDNKESSDSLCSLYGDFLLADNAQSSKDIVSYLTTDTTYTKISISESGDLVTVDVYEELRGHDPEVSHPYPQGLLLAVEDYNRIITTRTKKDNGERRSPWRFLDFAFSEFLTPDPINFKEEMKTDTFSVPGELRLFYATGSSSLNKNDSVNKAEIAKFRENFEELIMLNPSNSLDRIQITGQASPDGGYGDINSGNLSLAKRRALDAREVIRGVTQQGTFDKDIYKVAPWDSVVSLLRADGRDDIADQMQEVIDKNPGRNVEEAINIQNAIFRNKSYYQELRDKYLPRLRTVFYEYKIKQFGDLPASMILEKYDNGGIDSIKDFKRGEFWVLMEELLKRGASIDERREVAQLAYDKTRKDTSHWAYAAIHLAACNIAKGEYDLNTLDEFIKIERLKPILKDTFRIDSGGVVELLSSVKVKAADLANVFVNDGGNTYKAELQFLYDRDNDNKKRTITLASNEFQKVLSDMRSHKDTIKDIATLDTVRGSLKFIDEGRTGTYEVYYAYYKPDKLVHFQKGGYELDNKPVKDFDTGYITEYVNQPEVAANQLIMALKRPNAYWAKYIYELQAIANGGGVKYDTLVAISSCYNGTCAGEDSESKRLRDIVASTSLKNKVIINLYMDNPHDEKYDELEVAYEASKGLPADCSESNYLRSIIWNRKDAGNDNQDINCIDSASNYLSKAYLKDIRLIYDSSNDYDLLNKKGSDIVNNAMLSWEKKRALAVDSVAPTADDYAFLNYKAAIEEPDLEKARESMYKAFFLDRNYYNVVAVRMKGLQKRIAAKASEREIQLFNKLKAIRRSFEESEARKDIDAAYMQAQRDAQSLRKNNK